SSTSSSCQPKRSASAVTAASSGRSRCTQVRPSASTSAGSARRGSSSGSERPRVRRIRGRLGMGTERILGRRHHSRILAAVGLPSRLGRVSRAPFLIDDGVVFLNHGSYGACPEPVFAEYQRWQRELEREPVDFL